MSYLERLSKTRSIASDASVRSGLLVALQDSPLSNSRTTVTLKTPFVLWMERASAECVPAWSSRTANAATEVADSAEDAAAAVDAVAATREQQLQPLHL
ncbi:hypothetical protein L596_005765 [Steinernema carpocapsae]|uniref:Uncharacterized protein n=1 Tax=Steinernema carpocapsae TaxID=34508 RepID=A0A4U8V024_STECR|nr:hypothetical protein L596_005765 [Steinernema carpocapsae]